MGIAANIEARKSFEAIVAIADEIADAVPECGRQRYWDLIAEHVATRLPKPKVDPSKEPMTDLQAGRYETDTVLYFGKHAGKRVIDVDLDYLVWLAEDSDPFKVELRRYLASERIQRDLQKVDQESLEPKATP